MWPDRVSNPGPPTYESGALLIALRGPAVPKVQWDSNPPAIHMLCPIYSGHSAMGNCRCALISH